MLIPGATSTKATSADTMWFYVRADAIQRAASTTWTLTPNASADTGGGLQVFKITGMTLCSLAAVRSVAGTAQASAINNGAAAGTPAPVLGAAALTGNPLIGAVFNATSPATMTAPTGFTESQDVGYATPTTGIETAFASSGVTASTITWGSTSASIFCASVVEFDAGVGAAARPDAEEYKTAAYDRTARNRAATWMRRWEPRPSGILVPA